MRKTWSLGLTLIAWLLCPAVPTAHSSNRTTSISLPQNQKNQRRNTRRQSPSGWLLLILPRESTFRIFAKWCWHWWRARTWQGVGARGNVGKKQKQNRTKICCCVHMGFYTQNMYKTWLSYWGMTSSSNLGTGWAHTNTHKMYNNGFQGVNWQAWGHSNPDYFCVWF